MRSHRYSGLIALASAALLASMSVRAQSLLLDDVHLVHVEDGRIERSRSVLVEDGRIVAVQPAGVSPSPSVTRIDGQGMYLVPGLWDMHTHAHRAGRAQWHYPLYIAHGVVGIRDAATHLGSSLAFRAGERPPGPAPRVIWGSPALDRAPPILSSGLAVETPEAARQLVRLLAAQDYDFIKVYDGLSRENYLAIVEEARRLDIPVEGHVPLAMSPFDVVRAKQRTIEHLTLVLEACIPGTLDWIHAEKSADSMALMADPRLVDSLDRFDAALCQSLFKEFREAGTWQVPTLVQTRGYFVVDHDEASDEPRLSQVPPAVREAWLSHVADGDDAERASGAKVFARQHALVGDLHLAGVGILAGTDASDEAWVFPGSSLHDELSLFVDAGLSPLDALRTATLNPARYRANGSPAGALLAPGADADLVLVADNPLDDIAHLRDIRGVVLAGKWHGSEELRSMIEEVRGLWRTDKGE
jgi:hypothetical protein